MAYLRDETASDAPRFQLADLPVQQQLPQTNGDAAAGGPLALHRVWLADRKTAPLPRVCFPNEPAAWLDHTDCSPESRCVRTPRASRCREVPPPAQWQSPHAAYQATTLHYRVAFPSLAVLHEHGTHHIGRRSLSLPSTKLCHTTRNRHLWEPVRVLNAPILSSWVPVGYSENPSDSLLLLLARNAPASVRLELGIIAEIKRLCTVHGSRSTAAPEVPPYPDIAPVLQRLPASPRRAGPDHAPDPLYETASLRSDGYPAPLPHRAVPDLSAQ